MKMHASITPERLIEAVERRNTSLDNPGICTICGADVEGVEPDARNYVCEHCGRPGVYGADELLIMIF